ncbi:GGDEF domain-containing protein [Thiospirochaeta perfilievii]|uniref:GGDEF domain-containing protein n=1 Tax=Thiospirochaeta perfilievii TaxID=252967 RepID=A0A5C1QD18_9SPIO|nr:GGDEF domain-containing phosphodiesterase [Thiospirochaeta perfilievii]QEN05307.1 GGDEF domain-containing protein [Thiospirochaeta perfilievii]
MIVSGGGRFGLSSLYFIAAFSIFFLILDYTTGVILPIYYLIAMTLRLKFGSFTPESIFFNPTLRSRFSIVLILGTVFGILGSITINILIKHLSNLAFNDSKTGLPNSQKFKETFNDIINHCNLGVDQCVLVGIRIINLERIYANLGLYMGDKILLEIVKRLKFEQFKLLARWNESIFMGVFPASDILELEEKTKDLHKKLELNYEVEGISRSVQFILALSRYPNDGLSSDSIIKNVITLLVSKNKNHGDIIYFDEHKMQKEQYRFSLNDALITSNFDKDFSLVYQPKIRMSDRKCIGAEVLLRWRHTDLGLVSPEEFIPIAEEGGKIKRITRWVIETTFDNIHNNIVELNKYKIPISFAINLSVLDLKDPNTIPYINKMVRKYNINPKQIEFEVTESIQADQDPSIQNSLKTFHNMGFKIAIDDFGTGYSSLSYLHNLHVNNLKIDKSFVELINTGDKSVNYPVVDTIISLAQSMHLEVIAEGIETEEQFNYLKRRGCTTGQGWLFSKGIPLREFLTKLSGGPF